MDATTSLPLDSEVSPTTSRSTLTVSYESPLAENGAAIRHYAIIPFPQTYESGLKLLGKYISSPRPLEANEVTLKSSAKNRNGEWIWANFTPDDWLLVVAPGSEVGLFGKRPLESQSVFWGGQIYLVFGETKDGLTKWSYFNPRQPVHSINRPGSYAEAVEATKQCVRSHILEPGKTLTFYVFKDPASRLTEWLQFPSSTTTDADAWKIFVPLPHGVLGVIAV
ncbi:hypothetical protein C8F04DRAFT_1125064 [Mycena alexandri]|uniref:Uncharacterized protein n=1 Tax=Mycena alexandri TaxID=1745969 RepID=A0AAD6SEQ3_9AGAR|nr:hypothetical protein C8F04DRAFT_1125064 [Mycena alexandri]